MPRPGLSIFKPDRRSPRDHVAAQIGPWTRHRFAVLGVVLVGAIAAADWTIIAMERRAAIEDFSIATTNLATGMAAQTSRSLATVDAALADLASRLATIADPAPEPPQAHLRTQAVRALLNGQQRFLPDVQSLAVVDAQGRVANGSGSWPPLGMDMSAQEFFRHVTLGFTGPERSAEGPGAFVGRPRQDGGSGSWSAVLARRLDDAHGAPAGAVLADISLSALERFYQAAMPLDRTLTIARRDGVLLLRYPHQADAIGRDVMDRAGWDAAVAAGGGSYVGPDHFDHRQVLAAIRNLPGVPLVIETSVCLSDVLAGWRQQRLWLLLGGAAVSLVTISLLWLFARQVGRLADNNIQLAVAHGRLDLAMSSISQGLCFYDGDHRLVVCNRRYGEIYGLPPAAMQPGVPLADLIDHLYAACGALNASRDDYLMARLAVVRARKPHYAVVEMADGRTIAIQHRPIPDGAWVSTHEDITERRRAEDRISFMARHDMLTGLPNRSLLQERLAEGCARAGRGSGFALLFLDLDRFKAVNDTLGHAVGDELLREVAVRLRAAVRDGDTVARLGGDEFVILQTGLQAPEDSAALAERIIESVGAPYWFRGHQVMIGVSIGIDIAMSNHVCGEELMRHAGRALYAAKAERRGTFRFFMPDTNADARHRHALAT